MRSPSCNASSEGMGISVSRNRKIKKRGTKLSEKGEARNGGRGGGPTLNPTAAPREPFTRSQVNRATPRKRRAARQRARQSARPSARINYAPHRSSSLSPGGTSLRGCRTTAENPCPPMWARQKECGVSLSREPRWPHSRDE